MSTGILFALLTSLSWAICIFPFTQAARRLGSNALNHFRLLLATILIGVICLIFGSNTFLEIFSSEYIMAWIWLGLSGILGLTLGDYFAFSMYKVLGARRGSVLTTFAPAAELFELVRRVFWRAGCRRRAGSRPCTASRRTSA